MASTLSRSNIFGKGLYVINDLQLTIADLISDYITTRSNTLTDRQLINVYNQYFITPCSKILHMAVL